MHIYVSLRAWTLNLLCWIYSARKLRVPQSIEPVQCSSPISMYSLTHTINNWTNNHRTCPIFFFYFFLLFLLATIFETSNYPMLSKMLSRSNRVSSLEEELRNRSREEMWRKLFYWFLIEEALFLWKNLRFQWTCVQSDPKNQKITITKNNGNTIIKCNIIPLKSDSVNGVEIWRENWAVGCLCFL